MKRSASFELKAVHDPRAEEIIRIACFKTKDAFGW